MQTVAFCKCFLIFVLKDGKKNVGALLRKYPCHASYSIWTLHFICTHNVSFGCAVHFGSPCTWFYHIKKSDVNTKHSALCLCSAFVPYAHIHEHCFNYAMDKSVSWDIVECNGILLPSLFLSRQIWIRSLFKRYICSHSTRIWTTTTAGKKMQFSLNNYSDTFHWMRAISRTNPFEVFIVHSKHHQHQVTYSGTKFNVPSEYE